MIKKYTSHGDGKFINKDFEKIGKDVIFEKGVLVFHPENITIGNNVYIGHYSIIKGYFKNKLIIGNNVWIGQNVFIHSAGGIKIGNNVGIGPNVQIISSQHDLKNIQSTIISSPLLFEPVVIENNCDIGTSAIILPGITLKTGTIIGAGAIVTKSTIKNGIYVGNPAKLLRTYK